MKKMIIGIVMLLLWFSIIPVDARAGGGSSGGGGGSGGSGHSSTHSQRNGQVLPGSGLIVLAITAGFVYYTKHMKIRQMHKQAREQLEEAYQSDDFWDESELKDKVKESYYMIQQAWSDQDKETLRKYLTDYLYQQWLIKMNWQDFKNERNILDNIRLLNKTIVSAYDDENDYYDYFWVAIEGKMKDQTIIDHEVVNETNEVFIEYWKYLRDGDNILLDEILQEDEVKG